MVGALFFMKNKKSYTPSKWSGFKINYMNWWDNLNTDEKVKAKKKFVLQHFSNEKRKYPFPDIPNVENHRLSQLTDSHIYRIWVFKDYDSNLNK